MTDVPEYPTDDQDYPNDTAPPEPDPEPSPKNDPAPED